LRSTLTSGLCLAKLAQALPVGKRNISQLRV